MCCSVLQGNSEVNRYIILLQCDTSPCCSLLQGDTRIYRCDRYISYGLPTIRPIYISLCPAICICHTYISSNRTILMYCPAIQCHTQPHTYICHTQPHTYTSPCERYALQQGDVSHCNRMMYLFTSLLPCNTLQHTATHCNTLQPHTYTSPCERYAPHCHTLQHTATHCNTLQHTATHCNTLQHTAATHIHMTQRDMHHTATHCQR